MHSVTYSKNPKYAHIPFRKLSAYLEVLRYKDVQCTSCIPWWYWRIYLIYGMYIENMFMYGNIICYIQKCMCITCMNLYYYFIIKRKIVTTIILNRVSSIIKRKIVTTITLNCVCSRGSHTCARKPCLGLESRPHVFNMWSGNENWSDDVFVHSKVHHKCAPYNTPIPYNTPQYHSALMFPLNPSIP